MQHLFDDGIDVIYFLNNNQNPYSSFDSSKVIGTIGSHSVLRLNSIDKFGNEFDIREKYPSEFEVILGLMVPQLGQQDLLQILVNV